MSERRCEGCRWFRPEIKYDGKPFGVCRRSPPINGEFSEVSGDSVCGEWQDKHITPEEQERRELVRQFAVAIVQGWYASANNIGADFPADAWTRAKQLADYKEQT